MANEIVNPVLDGQERHWQTMLETKPEMFGRDASEAARLSAAEFKAAGVQRILELGGGQGRDSLFFAANGFAVHVLDYAQAGIEARGRCATRTTSSGRRWKARFSVSARSS